MTKRRASPAFIWLLLFLVFALPAWSWARTVMIIKGSTLIDGNLDGLVTLPEGLVLTRMEIEVPSWASNYGPEDLILYDPFTGACSLYEEALLSNLPDPDEILISWDGERGTLAEFLEGAPYVVYDTDLRMIGGMGLFAGGVPIPPPPPDTTPPETSILDGPSDVIGERDVVFTFSGADNATLPSNLGVRMFLEGYDTCWSGYSGAASKTYKNLPNGSYVFHVRARDEAQNVDPTPAIQRFTVYYLYGDLHEDGVVDLLDAIAALKVCAGIPSREAVNRNADVNEDGKIGIEEVIYILQWVSEVR
jgi:hypothetical protein